MAKDKNIEISDLDVENVFKDYGFHLACSVEGNLEDMDAL